MTMETKTATHCRLCANPLGSTLYSLGNQFVSNYADSLEDAYDESKFPRAPIDLVYCGCCQLLQQRHTAPQELLYRRTYWYKSGVTQTMRDALQDVADSVERSVPLRPGDIVLDIGSNDGTLLRCYRTPGLTTVGFEPAENLFDEGSAGLRVCVNDFWSKERYRDAVYGKARVVTALGMFYDLEDPNRFVADVAEVLADDGVFVAQLMCLKQTVANLDVGNLCHEHLEFYSLASLDYLFLRNGLEVFDVQENRVNGGSYRLWARRRGDKRVGPTPPPYAHFLRAERELGLHRPETHLEFFDRLESSKRTVKATLREMRHSGKRVGVYGASTKGNVILQYYGLHGADSLHGDPEDRLLACAAERSPAKWGKFTVGSGVRIVTEDEARGECDVMLVLPYAFFDEFARRERAWLDKGGVFVVPLPYPRVVWVNPDNPAFLTVRNVKPVSLQESLPCPTRDG